MTVTSNQDGKTVNISVTDDLSVTIIPHNEQEWLMLTSEVAIGYGVANNTIRSHKTNGEFVENVHFVPGVEYFDGSQTRRTTMWTKAGVIRLGFFIKSERAKMFRDWAERVVLAVTAPNVNLPKAPRRRHNRLTQSRLVDLLSLVALVDDAELRRQLVVKLNPDAAPTQLKLQMPNTDDHA